MVILHCWFILICLFTIFLLAIHKMRIVNRHGILGHEIAEYVPVYSILASGELEAF